MYFFNIVDKRLLELEIGSAIMTSSHKTRWLLKFSFSASADKVANACIILTYRTNFTIVFYKLDFLKLVSETFEPTWSFYIYIYAYPFEVAQKSYLWMKKCFWPCTSLFFHVIVTNISTAKGKKNLIFLCKIPLKRRVQCSSCCFYSLG